MKISRPLYLVCAVLLVAAAVYFLPKNLPMTTTAAVQYGLPVRLEIPSLNINASVEAVGLTADGAMDVPKIVGDVAWFTPGPRPGASGSAVIDGHYGLLKDGRPSVFDDLSKLKQGDKISVTDDRGVAVTFIVRESRDYDPSADASDIFTSSDGKAHLNLITCEGIWNKISKSYSQRLVVFADKE